MYVASGQPVSGGWCCWIGQRLVYAEGGWLAHVVRISGVPISHLFSTSFVPLSLCTSLVPLSRLLVLFFTRVYRMDGGAGLRVQCRRCLRLFWQTQQS